ncbi:MAG TPA: hypothetical protein VF532_02185 [Candidatus Angelobacter sp.]
MKVKFTLALMALFCFLAVPVFAQHDSGGHGGSGGGSMHDSHGSGHDANETHGGHGDHDNDANEHHGKHGDHDSHGNFAAKLSSNTKLAATLQALLPPGTNLQTAAQGFKNLGQFVAAVHVSKNLGIPFDQLKTKMTGPPPEKLGQAIHDLQPTADVKAALKQAKRQAEADLEGSEHDNDKNKNASTAKHNDNDKDDDSK